jgi:predicted RNase H-like HicB family nuclease
LPTKILEHILVWKAERRDQHMRFYSFQIVIEKESEDEGYFAYSPTIPGCFSNGKTIEETKRNIRDAIEQHLASLLEHAQTVPQHERLVHVEELSIGVP